MLYEKNYVTHLHCTLNRLTNWEVMFPILHVASLEYPVQISIFLLEFVLRQPGFSDSILTIKEVPVRPAIRLQLDHLVERSQKFRPGDRGQHGERRIAD